MDNNLKIEKAGLYTTAKLQNFGITENQIQDYRVNVIVEMTPEIARDILEANPNNRNTSPKRIGAYANDMLAGRWKLNGESVKIDSDGNLIDGQHRLQAVVKAGVTVPIEISYGLPTSAFTTLDTGKNRSAGDIISIYGNKLNSTIIAAALKVVIDCERGRQIGSTSTGGGNYSNSTTGTRQPITNQDIESAWIKHRNMTAYIPTHKDTRTIGHRPLFTALHYLFAQIDKEKADRFFETLYHGEFVIEGKFYRNQSIKLLRETLIDMYAHRDRNGNSNSRTIASMVIKTWNAVLSEKNLKKVKIADGEKQQPILGIDGKQMKLVV